MRLILALCCIAALMAGCSERTYELDFARAPGFHWSGRMRIHKAEIWHFGPLLTVESDLQTRRVELIGTQGQNAQIDPDGYEGFPIAVVTPAPPANAAVLGVTMFQRNKSRVRRSASSTPAETQPADPMTDLPADIPDPPYGKRPYAQHLNELNLADWWAIALKASDLVTLQFEVPEEDLVIVMQGRPDQYDGPAVVEIRNHAGQVLKRFERQPIAAQSVPPG